MSDLPPWLDVHPTDAADSLMRGLQLGLQMREARERHAMAQQQLGMEAQRLAASERQAASEAQIRRESIMANFQRAQQQAAMTKAYHDATLGLAKNRLDLEAKKLNEATNQKIKEISDTVGYAKAVANGASPLDARSQFPSAKLPVGEEKAKKQPMSDYAKAMHKSLADAYSTALKTGDITKVGAAAKQLREFDEKQNPEGLVQPTTAPTPVATFQSAQINPSIGGLKEGQRVRNKKTGLLGTVVNGEIVPDAAQR